MRWRNPSRRPLKGDHDAERKRKYGRASELSHCTVSGLWSYILIDEKMPGVIFGRSVRQKDVQRIIGDRLTAKSTSTDVLSLSVTTECR